MVKKGKMDTKGLELSINTIIILVMVLVALVVIVTFFLGGFSNLTDSVKRIFFGTTSGYDRTLAIQNCDSFCEQLKSLNLGTTEEINQRASESAYCKSSFNIDTDNDGNADTLFYCIETAIPTIVQQENTNTPSHLDVECNIGATTITC